MEILPFSFGTIAEVQGRIIPWMVLTLYIEPTTMAPLFPALENASMSPLFKHLETKCNAGFRLLDEWHVWDVLPCRSLQGHAQCKSARINAGQLQFFQDDFFRPEQYNPVG